MNIYLIVFAFIVLDFVTGMIKAFSSHGYSSGKMREGLWHKSSLVLVMVVAYLLDYAQGYLELGISIPVLASAAVYITLMELGSIIENLCIINPDLAPEKLKALFGAENNMKN